MCGRFSQTKSKQEIKRRFNIEKIPDGTEELFNIAPNQKIPAILNQSPNEITMAKWGLVPSWAKEEKTIYSMINARSETLLEKPSYKRLIKDRRCLIIADSFYEWKKVKDKKVPYRLMLKSEELFAFAGLWDLWEKEGKRLISCSIITTSPNKLCKEIHDRMPIILPREKERVWLSDLTAVRAIEILKPYHSDAMKCYEISPKVNNPLNNSADVIQTIK